MPRGLFITLEGLDGSGKTTQIKRLAAWLKKRAAAAPDASEPALSLPMEPALSLPKACPELVEGGLASETADSSHGVVVTRQPGGTPTGDRIRALVLDSRSTGLSPLTEMALMFADRAQVIAEVIEPALAAGKIVLCDRFTDSTEAYQGGGRQLGSAPVLELHRLLCSNLQPGLTLLLLPSLEASIGRNLARARHRNVRVAEQEGADEGRFEQEQDAFYHRVWEKYREIALREPHRVVLIEGDLSIEEVHRKIVSAVSARLLATGRIV
ncbi:MAG TPA: dTMP kinase [Terracidiphilus sp.]|jgi:dTMP kinase